MLQVIENNNMTPEQFVYWLQGYVEVHGEAPTEEQWQIIKDHIQTVFKKETPNYTLTIPNDPIDPGFTINPSDHLTLDTSGDNITKFIC